MRQPEDRLERVLVFAPIGRDGSASVHILQRDGIDARLCADLPDLVRKLEAGAAAAFIAEEGLFGADTEALFAWAAAQPPWSDLPFVVLTSHQELPAIAAWRHRLITALRTAALLERPVQALTLTSTIQSALRARRRQHEVRILLEARERAAEELEAQIIARTLELADANRELHKEMDERSLVEAKLLQTQKIEALGQLTGGVAHDFNNLLMVISGGLDMIDRQADPARRKRLIDGMKRAAQRGAALTKQLLSFSRRQVLRPEPVDLKRQIGGMQELLDRSLGGNVHVRFEFADDLWPVFVDPGELELVVLNLAVNARDAMPDGGSIVIGAQNAPIVGHDGSDLVRLSFKDTGSGMSPEIQARIFEPFFTTKEIGKGSGLGLAQVHGFAQQSGGSVEIRSLIGKGTTVTLLLPRSLQLLEGEKHRPADPDVSARGSDLQGSVLLVDDDNEVATLVAEMLDQLGYEVIRAASATAALGALANGRKIDIMFSDVMMPGGMNGLDLAREARARRQNLPILLTSGYAEAARTAAAAAGIMILPKPYDIDELAAALQLATSTRDGRDHPGSPFARCTTTD